MNAGVPGLRDQEILAANRAILRRRFPDLVRLIDSFAVDWPSSIHAQVSRSGLPTISVDDGATQVHVHSTFKPTIEAERWLKEPLGRDWNAAVVFGMGLAYHVDALLEQRPRCRLIVIEPRPDVFYAALALRDQQRLLSHPDLELIVTDDPVVAAHRLLSERLKVLSSDSPIFAWPAAARYAPDFWKTLESELLSLVRMSRGDLATAAKFQRRWIENFFQNISLAATDPGISSLRRRFAGRPTVIVAAGPSLEKNIHLLSAAKGKAVLIAAGSAINPMLQNGIEPELLVSYDPGKGNYRHFQRLRTPNIPLVYVPTIFPRILNEYLGPRFTAAMNAFPFVDWVFQVLGEEKGTLASGPSVANVAWHLAVILGSNPIILVGQDLAYTDGKTHAAGVANARAIDLLSPDKRFITVEGIDGSPVVTSPVMYNMKAWFEHRLANAPAELITIDATEGGARIKGTAVMPLQEALEKHCRDVFDPYETIIAVHRAESERRRGSDYQTRLCDAFDQLEEQLRTVVKLSEAGLADAHGLLRESTLRKLTGQRLGEAITRLGRHTTTMARVPVYRFFIEPVTAHVLQSVGLVIQARLKEETNLHRRGAEIARQYVTLFTSVRDAARQVERSLEEDAQPQAQASASPPVE